MTRQLFESEKRTIRNIALKHLGRETAPADFVYFETYSAPAREGETEVFNSDFRLQFDERDLSEIDFGRGTTGGMAPVLPNTLGAEVFLTVEKGTYRPLLLHLLGGEAFPMKYFATYVRHLEAMLNQLGNSQTKATLADSGPNECIEASGRLKGSIREVSIKQSAYSRILVVGSDICFLVFPDATSPVMRGVRHTLARSPQCEVHCFVSGSEITCLDGWLSTEVPASEYKLAATWEPLE